MAATVAGEESIRGCPHEILQIVDVFTPDWTLKARILHPGSKEHRERFGGRPTNPMWLLEFAHRSRGWGWDSLEVQYEPNGVPPRWLVRDRRSRSPMTYASDDPEYAIGVCRRIVDELVVEQVMES